MRGIIELCSMQHSSCAAVMKDFFNYIVILQDLGPIQDSVVTEQPFIIHKRKRSKPKSFDIVSVQ